MNISKSESAFLGNDINDLEAFDAVGLKMAVKDSYQDVLDAADLILEKKGGMGAVREACDYILKNNLNSNLLKKIYSLFLLLYLI